MTLTTTSRNNQVDDFVDRLNSGTIVFHSAAHAEVATCTFGATAFGSSSGGTATANAITDDSSATGGTIDHAHLITSGATDLAELTVSTSGADINLDQLTVGAGDTVQVTSFSVSCPAS